MIVAIHQPNYLPWIGYFAKIAATDVFVFFDTVQMPMAKSFVSRNRILTAHGSLWLTVPTNHGSKDLLINNAEIVRGVWPRKHLRTIEVAYAGSADLKDVVSLLQTEILSDYRYIADLNIALILKIAQLLGIEGKKFIRASELGLICEGKDQVHEILEKLGATRYVTGSGAGSKQTIDEEEFAKHGISLDYLRSDFGVYPQRFRGDGKPYSVIDPILNFGIGATRQMLK